MQVGDKIRTKSQGELVSDDDWVFDPFQHVWRFVPTGAWMLPREVDKVYTVLGIDEDCQFVEVEGGGIFGNISFCAIAEVLNETTTCECSMEKFGFEWHMKFCPDYTDPMKGKI